LLFMLFASFTPFVNACDQGIVISIVYWFKL
jgi:hypothetical protein